MQTAFGMITGAPSVDDRPSGVAELVQHQALTWREPDPQLPLLPRHRVPVHREAGAVGLSDLDRLDVVTVGVERRDVVRLEDPRLLVVARLPGDRDDAVVVDLDHLARVEVHDRDEALDGPRVPVLSRRRAHPGERAGDPADGGVVLGSGPARGPRVDHRE
jgi:hypothetical protein